MRLGVLICCYNRPEYLKQCLESVKVADLSKVSVVVIVDDCSTDIETRRLIDDYHLDGIELIKAFSKENRSIKGSLLTGFELLFSSCDVVTNLDSDAIITKEAFSRLVELSEKFPGYIITGFNCSTKNKNGTERHIIIEQGDGWNKKYSVGGINMMFGQLMYLQVVKPALQKSLKQNLNWDHQTCIASNEGYGKPIVVLEPSCVQHIGISSSMGHTAGGEPPDVADDFVYDSPKDYGTRLYISRGAGRMGPMYEKAKLHIPAVTFIAVDDNLKRIQSAADVSCDMIQFGAVKLLSHEDSDDPRVIKIRKLGSRKEYSQFILKELSQYVDTPFAIIFQHDGYVLNFQAWTDEFFNYDAVGAVWDFRDHKRTCNGGFCIRSKKLLDITANDEKIFLKNDHLIHDFQEDHVLFYIYREYLESNYKIKIAPENICNQFSMEAWGKRDKSYKGSFGFHGFGIDFSKANLKYKPY